MEDYAKQLSEALQNVAKSERPGVRGTRSCPVCGNLMLIEELFEIKTDVCREHGIWLDTGELPGIIDRVRAGTRQAGAKAIREARTRGMLSGIFFGAFSFLFDPFADE